MATVVSRYRAPEEPLGWSTPTRLRAMIAHDATLESLKARLCWRRPECIAFASDSACRDTDYM